MIENYLNGRVWNRLRMNADISRGLANAGFVLAADVTDGEGTAIFEEIRLNLTPNPFHGSATIDFRLPTPGNVTLVLTDVAGREVARLIDGHQAAGVHLLIWTARAFQAASTTRNCSSTAERSGNGAFSSDERRWHAPLRCVVCSHGSASGIAPGTTHLRSHGGLC